jgi:AraC-like DNA-binding protein
MRSLPVYDIGTVSQQREHELQVSRFAAYINSHHKDLHSAHKHSFYHLVYFTKGNGQQTIDFEAFPVKPGLIYFMAPGQVHSWAFEGDVDGYIINFSGSFFQSFLLKADYLDNFPFFSGVARESVIEIPVDQQAHLQSLFEQLLDELSAAKAFSADIVKTLMLQMFVKVARTNGVAGYAAPAYNHTLLRNFYKLIEKHYRELKLPKEYAELLFITPNHLNALCRSVMGKSAGDIIRDRILLEAKRLLVNRDMTVLEIANHLNFADNSYFTKFFKKQTGQTPEIFRKNLNSKYHG